VNSRDHGLDNVEFHAMLDAARAGAAWACTRIFDSLSGPVRGYLAARGAQDPDDLTSEVFLGVFRNLHTFEGDGDDLRTWIFTIAHHRLVDDRRRRARRPRTTPLDPSRHDTPGDDDPIDNVVDGLQDSSLAPYLAQLRPLERDTVLLRVVAGLDVEQTAAVLGVRAGHVRVLQHRALNALRSALEQDA
jgi:RNA polymerase sigma-70 factor (ECF subfamily)